MLTLCKLLVACLPRKLPYKDFNFSSMCKAMGSGGGSFSKRDIELSMVTKDNRDQYILNKACITVSSSIRMRRLPFLSTCCFDDQDVKNKLRVVYKGWT